MGGGGGGILISSWAILGSFYIDNIVLSALYLRKCFCSKCVKCLKVPIGKYIWNLTNASISILTHQV